jgi:GT2 family glycosyltransferase
MSIKTYGIGVATFNDSILINHFLDSVDLYTDRRNNRNNRNDDNDNDNNNNNSNNNNNNNELKIAVLDDGSTKENQEAVRKICKNHNVDFICHDKNLGVPKSWNDLVKYLNTDYIILSNNDIILYKNWFENIKFFLENNDNIGTVSLPILIVNREDISSIIEKLKINPNERCIEILEPCTRKRREGIFNLSETGDPIRITYPIGCIFGFSRKAYDMIGGFNESYHSFYEEVEFGIELYKKRLYSYILPGPHVYHVWGATFQINSQIDGEKIMNISRKIFTSKYGKDYTEVFKTLDNNFNTTISYLYGIDNNVKKDVIINNTHFIDWCKEW